MKSNASALRDHGMPGSQVLKFVMTHEAMTACSGCKWEVKYELYKSLGWSECELLSVFRKFPYCMMVIGEEDLERDGILCQGLGVGAVLHF
ncbi:hypothetical protein QJS04_geneDACA023851 [Acorus gramineus]|uniref:Uncharacterized protein n=1 Tax=Acorus gramineus TaxID=55184 RepID=A0AAV9BQF2_ACOGR|nr:hypothetical protein QJS04_geneDACA023851 [Acorus gramineus]